MSDPPQNDVRAISSPQDLEDLFENAPCGYLLLHTDGRIVRANATFAGWIGTTPSKLAGKRLRDLLTIPGRIFYETNFAPMLRLAGGFEEVALDVVANDGEKLPLLVNASERRDAGGDVVGVRVVAVRAWERRGYERDLQNREALAVQQLKDERATSGLREQFIAVLGHDLRNPLAAVSSGVRLLQRDPTKEKADRIAAMMQESVLRMSGMIENVLDFARGRLGGGINLQRGPADLEALLHQVVDELRAARPDCQIGQNYSLPPLIDCDAPRIAQMVSNLAGNACTHGDPATFVTVSALVVSDELEISVANGGDPIPESTMKALFQPFSHEPGSGPRQGLGLGLFIASEIAKSHGGTLTASSSAEETRFTFRMPLASA